MRNILNKIMPELPEVEMIKRGVESVCLSSEIANCKVYTKNLRYSVLQTLPVIIKGQAVSKVIRRGKILLLIMQTGFLMMHFGMSGKLIISDNTNHSFRLLHEHLVINFANGFSLKYLDPRKFGYILWSTGSINQHPFITKLGVEPLTKSFNDIYMYAKSMSRRIKIKSLLMDGRVVAGIGNIYANELLFLSSIKPDRKANTLSFFHYTKICFSTRMVLIKSLRAGGTTIKDFRNHHGCSGTFQKYLNIYGRTGNMCYRCSGVIKEMLINSRRTYYCSYCQE